MASTSHVGPAANSACDPLLVSTYIIDNTDVCDSEFHMRLQAYRATQHFRYNTNKEQNQLLDVMLSSLDIFVLIFQMDWWHRQHIPLKCWLHICQTTVCHMPRQQTIIFILMTTRTSHLTSHTLHWHILRLPIYKMTTLHNLQFSATSLYRTCATWWNFRFPQLFHWLLKPSGIPNSPNDTVSYPQRLQFLGLCV